MSAKTEYDSVLAGKNDILPTVLRYTFQLGDCSQVEKKVLEDAQPWHFPHLVPHSGELLL
jgi:hypothetical protein